MATLNVSVTASTDDGYYASVSGTTFSATATFLNLGVAGGGVIYGTWMRFLNVTIPQGSTISSAVITFVSSIGATGTVCNVKINCEDADNPVVPTTAADARSRARTSNTLWSSIGSWTTGTSYATPNFSASLQTVINRVGFASGNAIQVFIEDNGSTTGAIRQPASWDHTTRAEPALDITYTDPAGQPTVVRFQSVFGNPFNQFPFGYS